jgi:Protein of unknown function (DUF2934)
MNINATPAPKVKAKATRKPAAPSASKSPAAKSPTAKPVTENPVKGKSPTAKGAVIGKAKANGSTTVSADERLRMIADCAYFLAQARGFMPGDTQSDWLEAEARIDAQLGVSMSSGSTRHV